MSMEARSASRASESDVLLVLSRLICVLPLLLAELAATCTKACPTSENTEMNIAPANRSQKCVSTCPGIPALPSRLVPGLSRFTMTLSGLRRHVQSTNTRDWPCLMPLLTSPVTIAPLSMRRTLLSAEYTSRLTWHDTNPGTVVSSSVFVPHWIILAAGTLKPPCLSILPFPDPVCVEVILEDNAMLS